MIENKTGGKVVNSGGFGCIFRPAIKCINPEHIHHHKTNYLTKLMDVKNAKKEYNLITELKTHLKHIPNYQDYFLLDGIYLCQPDKLTTEDLVNYNKCTVLHNKNINIRNINASLDKLLALNIPDGGIDVATYVKTHYFPDDFVSLNNSLINLLVNGILPMNQSNIYHCDIKDTNVLIKSDNNSLTMRLIDWGTCVIKTESDNVIHSNIQNRKFQFNAPFSNIIFNNLFIKSLNKLFTKSSEPTYQDVREFVINYIFSMNSVDSGHLSEINSIIRKLMKNQLYSIKNKKIRDHLIEYGITYNYIIDYITHIIIDFTIDGEFKILDYYNQVYVKNIDIWGFIMIYISIFEIIYHDIPVHTKYHKAIMNYIKHMFIHFLYETPTKPIDVQELVSYLQQMNDIIPDTDTDKIVGGTKILIRGSNKTKRKQTNKKRTRVKTLRTKK